MLLFVTSNELILHRLNIVLCLCNLFLFDLNLQGLLHKLLLLFHRVVLGSRCCLTLLCDLFKIDLLKLDDLLSVL